MNMAEHMSVLAECDYLEEKKSVQKALKYIETGDYAAAIMQLTWAHAYREQASIMNQTVDAFHGEIESVRYALENE